MFKDYNMNQLILPLDLAVKLQENDIAFSIHHLVESIPHEAFNAFVRYDGCPAYHPRMMLKIILCGYTQSAFSGRKIEDLVKDSIRMMWLAQGYEPSYRTIKSFSCASRYERTHSSVFCTIPLSARTRKAHRSRSDFYRWYKN